MGLSSMLSVPRAARGWAQSNMGPILQRAPMLSHFTMVPFVLIGPFYMPYAYGLVLISLHLLLWTVNFRTLWGAYTAWRSVVPHALTDFRSLYHSTLNKLPLSRRSRILPYDAVEHLIIVPNYAEDITVLRETLHLLSTHPLALTNYHPVLAMEAREKGSIEKAQQLLSEFRSCFMGIGYTVHPGGLVGEASGKSSNLAWAIRQAWQELRDEGRDDRISRTVVTVIDSDTALAGDYFADVSCKFAVRQPSERARMTFCPPICFDRNAHEVPIAVRMVDIMWALAGLSSVFPTSGAKIPTSAYSLSLTLAANVGFHDADPQSIGEDMHMFIKCLFSTGGNLISETIYSPASQLDVVSGQRTGWRGYFNDHVARYHQALRHMWGSLDTGYGITRLLQADFSATPIESLPIPPPRQPDATVYSQQSSAPIHLGQPRFAYGEPAPNASISHSASFSSMSSVSSHTGDMADEESSVTSVDELEDEKLALGVDNVPLRRQTKPFISMVMRLYEAHMLLGHMTLMIALQFVSPYTVSPDIRLTLPTWQSFADPHEFAGYMVVVTSRMRAYSALLMVLTLLCYDRYHQATVKHRWAIADNRLGMQSADRSERRFPVCMVDYLGIYAGLAFGLIPLMHAQFMQLFTDKLVYTVSLKPIKDRRSVDPEKAVLA